jgi:hypothetical protein
MMQESMEPPMPASQGIVILINTSNMTLLMVPIS